MLALIKGRIARIIDLEDHSENLVKVSAVTGTRVLRATAGKRPSPGWRPDPADRRKWTKHVDIVEELIIDRNRLIGDEWPVGYQDFCESHGISSDPAPLIDVIRPIMERAVGAGGIKARRVRPNLHVNAIESDVKRAGLPMPNESELETVLTHVWNESRPARPSPRSSVSAAGRTIIPPKPEPKPEPSLDEKIEKHAQEIGDNVAKLGEIQSDPEALAEMAQQIEPEEPSEPETELLSEKIKKQAKASKTKSKGKAESE